MTPCHIYSHFFCWSGHQWGGTGSVLRLEFKYYFANSLDFKERTRWRNGMPSTFSLCTLQLDLVHSKEMHLQMFWRPIHYQWPSEFRKSIDICAKDASMCRLWSSMNPMNREWPRKAHNEVAEECTGCRCWVLPKRQYVPSSEWDCVGFCGENFNLWTSICILFNW